VQYRHRGDMTDNVIAGKHEEQVSMPRHKHDLRKGLWKLNVEVSS
jgi:hypothetical protein